MISGRILRRRRKSWPQFHIYISHKTRVSTSGSVISNILKVAQAVSRWLPTAAARVRVRAGL
jgi:hypothetical protein